MEKRLEVVVGPEDLTKNKGSHTHKREVVIGKNFKTFYGLLPHFTLAFRHYDKQVILLVE